METRIIGYENEGSESEKIILEHGPGLREIIIAVMLAMTFGFWLGYFVRSLVEKFLSFY